MPTPRQASACHPSPQERGKVMVSFGRYKTFHIIHILRSRHITHIYHNHPVRWRVHPSKLDGNFPTPRQANACHTSPVKAGKIIILLIALISFTFAIATTIKAPAIHKDYYIGEIIEIPIDLSQHKPEKLFVQRDFDETKVVVREIEPVKDKPWQYLLRIAVFDTGYVDLGKIPIYNLEAGVPDTIFVEPFTVRVKSSLSGDEKPSDDIPLEIKDIMGFLKDIQPPLKFRLKFLDYFVPILIILLIATGFYFLTKLKTKERVIERVIVDNRPSWMIAMELLSALKKKRLLEDGQYLEFYFELSLILRIFLELQYKIKAAEMTTYEIKQVLPAVKSKQQILNTLTEMDKIKFAKFTPEFTEAKAVLDWVEGYFRGFAHETPVETGDQ